MKRLSKQFISVLLVLCMVMSFLGVFAAAETVTTAKLVTDVSSLKAGDQIIIAAAGYGYAMSTTQNSNNRGRAEITKSDDGTTITVGEDTQIITLAAGTIDGTFAFVVNDGKYLYAASSSGNYLRSGANLTESASWNITIDASTGIAGIVAAGTYTRNTMRYNTSGLFACYAASNTQKDLSIYIVTGSSEGADEPEPVGTTATLVTDGTSLNAGDKIIIVAAEMDFALSTTQNTNNRGQAAVVKNGTTLTFYEDTQVITLAEGAVAGTLALGVGNDTYLYAASSKSNYMKSGTTLDENASFNIDIDAGSGLASIVAVGANTRNTLRYNSSSSLFSCYAESNTMKDICIYMVEDTQGTGGSTGGSGDDSGSDSEDDTQKLNYTATLVTNTSALANGDQIFIVAFDHNYVLSTTQNTSNRGQTAAIKINNTLIAAPDAQPITLGAGIVSGTYSFGVGEGQYLYAAGSTANNLKTTSTLNENGSWNISFDAETGAAIVVAAGANTRNTIRYNISSSLFSCYLPTNTMHDILIYEVTGTTTEGDFGGSSEGGSTADDAGNSDALCNHNWSDGACTVCGETYILMVTTPTGYTSADQVVYVTKNGYIVNWGARGEEIDFLSTYATKFYSGEYTYASLSDLSSRELYTALQDLMTENHTTFTKYGSTTSSVDCRNFYAYTDCLLSNTDYVSTIYRGLYVSSVWNSAIYNQEHVWPNSKCIGENSTDIGDIMHLRPSNPSENSSRGNLAYGEGTGYYDPGMSVRGDVARTVLYMYTRWGNTNLWGTDGVFESQEILLKWIQQDPVDTWEMGRNDAVQSITGTRNVFVDYPEYAYLIFGEEIPANLSTPSNSNDSSCADGHSYTSKVTAPTCTTAGYTTYTCSACGNSYVGNPTAATGHSFVKGSCSVCGVKDPDYIEVVVPTLTLSYPSLSFEDEILYNVYYTLDNATSIVEMGLITFNSRLADGTINDAAEVIPGYVNSGSTYMVQSKGIPAKNLSDAVYFKVYAKLADGSYVYSGIAGYHAVAYANSVLNSNAAAKAKALVVAMLNYGAAAQEYFGYKTDALMNANLTAEQQALVSAYDPSMVQDVVKADSSKVGSFKMNGGYSNIYPTVSFEGAFSINFYFTPNKTVDKALTFYYWDAKTYASVDVLTAENATGVITMTQDGSNWGAAVAGIAAKAIDETVYVAAIYTSNGVSYPTSVISYSLGNYCKTIATNGEVFGAATAVYGFYAKAYFAA